MALQAGEITAIVAVCGNMVAWAKLFSDQKKMAKNGGGPAGPCQVHHELNGRVVKIEGSAERLQADVSRAHAEDRQDHARIFEKLEGLGINVALAADKAMAAHSSASIAAVSAAGAASAAASAAATAAAAQSALVELRSTGPGRKGGAR